MLAVLSPATQTQRNGGKKRDGTFVVSAERGGTRSRVVVGGTMTPEQLALYVALDLDCYLPRQSGSAAPVSAALAATAPTTPPQQESLPLLPEHISQLELMLERDPEGIATFLGRATGEPALSLEQAKQRIEELRATLDDPPARPEQLSALVAVPAQQLPADFDFPGYERQAHPIDVNRRDFEDQHDRLRYVLAAGLNGALYHTGLLPLDPFRWHHEAASKFDYELERPAGKDLKLALFSDFANGYEHTYYISKLLAQYRYAVHLGDVYYAGRHREVTEFLEKPLKPLEATCELFLLAGNHEMYAKARPWLSYLDRKRAASPERQRQEGTYFRLIAGDTQIVAIDTVWFKYARYDNARLMRWLADVLEEGRGAGRTNILLSSNEPYEYGKPDLTKLWTRDLAPLAQRGLIDLWFWGNTHYAALFDRSPQLPFVGSCIGHGGFPYERQRRGAAVPSGLSVPFLEDRGRYWPLEIRKDVGNNGFCALTLRAEGGIGLDFIDWRGEVRHHAALRRANNGSLSWE